jgi:hypothetical protein
MRPICRDVTERLYRGGHGRPEAADASAIDAHLAACEGCRRQAERLAAATVALRHQRTLPDGFGERLQRRIVESRGRRKPQRPARPVAWRLLPAAAALVLAVGLARFVPRADPQVEPPRITVELSLAKADARHVTVAGDFNDWQVDAARMVRGQDGVWRIRLQLPPGRYQYVFVVDENEWIADPQASTVVDSGFSGANSVLDLSL